MARSILLLVTTFLVTLATAACAQSCSESTGIYSFQFGDFNATIIQDGFFPYSTNPFVSVDESAVLRSWRFYNPGEETVSASLNTMVLVRDSTRLLFDAGFGNRETPGKTIQGMKEVGIAPESITGVLLTHAHVDHIGGLTSADGSAAFPNASVYVHRKEFEYWTGDPLELAKVTPDLQLEFINSTASLFTATLKLYDGKVVLVDDNQTLFDGVHVVPTRGHTPGHMSFRVESDGKSMFITGDAIAGRTTTVQHPEWNFFSDTNRTATVQTRLKMLDSLAAKKDLVMAFHELFPGLGYIIPHGPFFDFSASVKI